MKLFKNIRRKYDKHTREMWSAITAGANRPGTDLSGKAATEQDTNTRAGGWVRSYVSQQKNILLIFTVVMLAPNIILCFTEPYAFTTILANLLLPAGVYLLWGLVGKRPGGMMLAALPLMILGAFQIVLLYLFGNSIIAVDMFTNLFTTTVSEAGELLGNIYPAIIAVCAIYLPLLWLAGVSLHNRERLPGRFRRRAALVGCALLLAGFICTGISKLRNPLFAVRDHVFPVNVMNNIHISVKRWNLSSRFPETSADFRFGVLRRKTDPDMREIYVLVVGEASRAASWQLFGYDRNTNPRLSGRKGLVPYRDMLTQSNATHKSVPIILSSASAENHERIYAQKGICALFKEAGFRTLFISCENPNRSMIDFLASEADSIVHLDPEKVHDMAAIPYLRQAIELGTDDLFVVIHTYGSHFDYLKRYPEQFAHYLPDQFGTVTRKTRREVVNAYDNSILYTDHVLSEVIGVLDSTQACTALFYCPDHGEDLLDDDRHRFLHASPTPTYYQLHLACLGWFSDEYRSVFPERYAAALSNTHAPATTMNVFHTVGDMAGIGSEYVDPQRSLVNRHFKARERNYLNDHYKAIPFYDAGLKREDFLQLDLHGIDYAREDVRRIRY